MRKQTSRTILGTLLVLFSHGQCLLATFAEDSVVGFSRIKPANGRFVVTDRGYMIEYTATIPGTDARFTMLPIPGGKFVLGSPNSERERQKDEGPQIKITLAPYWIGKYEVTWREYNHYAMLRPVFRKLNDLGLRKVTDQNRADAVTAPSSIYYPEGRFPADKKGFSRHPAVSMRQFAAKQYTKWLSKLTGRFYRLPSEAEWEFACRAGSKTARYFGNDAAELQDHAWYFVNSNEETHPVGLKKPNAWGLHDMLGNAAEWFLDEYRQSGYGLLKQQVETGKSAIVWPTKVFPRVVRGGSWNSNVEECRSAFRLGSSRDWMNEDAQLPPSPWWLASAIHREIGFRIVRPLNPPEANDAAKYWDADVPSIRTALKDRLINDDNQRGIVDPDLPNAIRRSKKK